MNGFYWIYLVMLAALLGHTFAKSTERKRLIYWGACGFLLMMFLVQDFSISADIAEYMRQFEIIPTLSFGEMLNHKFEIGYVLLCRIIDTVFESDRVLLLAVACIMMLPYFRSFEQETEAPMVALMAYCALGMYMHAIIIWRQMCAMAILTFSYRFIRERKLLPFLLTVLIAMTFHKTSIIFIGLYVVYNIPINKWLLVACALCAVFLGLFSRPIIEFGIAHIYPRYTDVPRLVIGGKTLLVVLWVVVLFSYWLLKGQLQDSRVRIPFLMVLIAATIQPVCFAFYDWCRIVLFFRFGLIPLSAQLYVTLFERKDGNKALALLQRLSPALHASVRKVYDTKWFRAAVLILMFAVLFFWYVDELDGAVYIMTPVK